MAKAIIRDRGFNLTDNQREMIIQALDDAERMARDVLTDFNRNVWEQRGRVRQRRRRRRDAWSSHPTLSRWFGGSRRHILIRRIRRRMNRLREWTKGDSRIIVKTLPTGRRHCDDGTNAFVTFPPRRVLRIHLCRSWFTGPLDGAAPGATSTPASRRAAIIIHELVHELGFAHPEGVSTAAEALGLAQRNSRKARRSPENFEHYYEQFF